MTDLTATAPMDPTLFDETVEDGMSSRWSGLADDLRFFLICYFAGLIVFLVMLS